MGLKNYTQDQMNYSPSYLYNFLPIYPLGLRTSYNVTASHCRIFQELLRAWQRS